MLYIIGVAIGVYLQSINEKIIMERGISVLILESSKAVAVQIVNLIKNMPGIKDVFYGPTFDKPIFLLYSDNIDVVICGLALSDENISTMLQLRLSCKPFCLIQLTQDTAKDKKKYDDLGIDYYLSYKQVLIELPPIILHTTKTIFTSEQMLPSNL